jgi:hypothetical protein
MAVVRRWAADLGWSAHFLSQLTPGEIPTATPARVTAIHRDRVQAAVPEGIITLILPPDMPMSSLAVGDWVLYDGPRITRLLERKTLLTRRAAGSGAPWSGQSIRSGCIPAPCPPYGARLGPGAGPVTGRQRVPVIGQPSG